MSELSDYLQKLDENNKLFNSTRQTIYKIANDVGEKAKIKLFGINLKGKTGIYPQFFRDSYRYTLIHNGADDNLADLKLRVSNEYNYRGFTFEHLKEKEAEIYRRNFSEGEIQKYCAWYKNHFHLYDELSKSVKGTLEKVLSQKSIKVQEISSRPKTFKSYEKKLHGSVSFSPYDMQDFAGIRIICYSPSDVDKISEIMKEIFEIDSKRTRDRKEILGTSKMGYRSTNYVAKLPESRYVLQENRMFKGKHFEIQLKTILQHAWDLISRDIIYKETDIPRDVKRRFNLVSSLLEIADNELEELQKKKLIK
jgi:ppGpp synthetase/RelA/SpoT-type nucleotidyltranferase